MNDPKLKHAMARLLPETLEIRTVSPSAVGSNQNDTYQVIWWKGKATALLETEWLYVMHLVEQTLDDHEHIKYRDALWDLLGRPGLLISATFNQRATAMCKVKGIEV